MKKLYPLLMKKLYSLFFKYLPFLCNKSLNAKKVTEPGNFDVAHVTYKKSEYRIVPGRLGIDELIINLNNCKIKEFRIDEDRDYIYINGHQYTGQKI